MLTRFEVTNFKNFKETLIFDLTQSKKFQFNEKCVLDGIVNKALIYGHNGTGKSNLGYAIFDLIAHITTKNINVEHYSNYLNANSEDKFASFFYEFKFDEGIIKYTYTKKNIATLISEKLEINGKIFAEIDRSRDTKAVINAVGAETLNKDLENSKVSIVTYIHKNTILDMHDTNNIIFQNFVNFVDNMLFFRSLNDGNTYMGHTAGERQIDQDIIEHNHVDEFEVFLNRLGIICKLDIVELGDVEILVFVIGSKKIPFYDIASSGTRSLALFYFWFQRMQEGNLKFIFIDEFDAFYHFELAKNIIEILKNIDIQIVLTTHNTSLMSNELLRPDCYFLLNDNKINTLANLTVKELREAHNIEKMYKAGSFSG